jgi:hypothetical protein
VLWFAGFGRTLIRWDWAHSGSLGLGALWFAGIGRFLFRWGTHGIFDLGVLWFAGVIDHPFAAYPWHLRFGRVLVTLIRAAQMSLHKL